MLSVTVHIHGMIAAHVGCDRTHQNQSDVNSTLRWICNLLRSSQRSCSICAVYYNWLEAENYLPSLLPSIACLWFIQNLFLTGKSCIALLSYTTSSEPLQSHDKIDEFQVYTVRV